METMTTKNDNNKPKPQAANNLTAELAAMEGIPVYELTFAVGMNNKPDIPYGDSSGGGGKLRVREGRKITYLTKAQLYRVDQIRADSKTEYTTVYIPREWACFEPLK